MVLLATKAKAAPDHQVRVAVLEDWSGFAGRDAVLAALSTRIRGRRGRAGGVRIFRVPQADLLPDIPWPVKHSAEDAAARVVVELERALEDDEAVVTLEIDWSIFMGIETGADAYTKRIRNSLPAPVRVRVDATGANIGDPILQLSPGLEETQPWSDHPRILARSPEARAILYGAIDERDYVTYVRIEGGAEAPEAVRRALERWEPVLAERAEIRRNATRRWWETAWPRDSEQLSAPKVVGVHRTSRGRFAVDEAGEWRPGKMIVVAVGRQPDAPVAYLCGILNSELIDLWYALRGRVARDIWRDYEPAPMRRVPYRRHEDDARAEEVAELVRQIAANRRALLPRRSVIRDLTRTVKDPWKDGPVIAEDAALIAQLPDTSTVSVRIDSALHVIGDPVGKATRTSPGVLAFRRGGKETGRVEGEGARLDLLEVMLAGKATDDATKLVLPKDVDGYARMKDAREGEVRDLLMRGRDMVERVERLVCSLYDVPEDLTDAVVEHAVARAQSSRPTDD